MIHDTLIINSYAGSLVLGATQAGLKIRGSYEDSGFGIDAQKMNFPKVKFVDNLPWPKDDLTKSIVLAHPPCASFSLQNNTKDKRGTNTEAFECHRRVMDYAMGNKCAALAIESVTGALTAASVYNQYARKYKYTNYFIVLNAASFGVPQWRPRAWMLFFRDQARISIVHNPEFRPIQSILQKTNEVTLHPKMKHCREYFMKKAAKTRFDYEAWEKFEGIGAYVNTVSEFSNVEKSRAGVDPVAGIKGLYGANLPRKLDPMWFAPVILGGCFFYIYDRPLTQIEYQRIMGFPDDWKWPASMDQQFLMYLSKGVCPPIAKWIAIQMAMNVEKITPTSRNAKFIAPGEILNLKPNREEAIAGIRKYMNLPLPLDLDTPMDGKERFALQHSRVSKRKRLASATA